MDYLPKLTVRRVLAVYLLICVFFYILLKLFADEPASYQGSGDFRPIVVVLDISTGGNPNDYADYLDESGVTLTCAWLLRVLSWLFIASVISYIVGRVIETAQSAALRKDVEDAFEEIADNLPMVKSPGPDFQRGLAREIGIETRKPLSEIGVVKWIRNLTRQLLQK